MKKDPPPRHHGSDALASAVSALNRAERQIAVLHRKLRSLAGPAIRDPGAD